MKERKYIYVCLLNHAFCSSIKCSHYVALLTTIPRLRFNKKYIKNGLDSCSWIANLATSSSLRQIDAFMPTDAVQNLAHWKANGRAWRPAAGGLDAVETLHQISIRTLTEADQNTERELCSLTGNSSWPREGDAAEGSKESKDQCLMSGTKHRNATMSRSRWGILTRVAFAENRPRTQARYVGIFLLFLFFLVPRYGCPPISFSVPQNLLLLLFTH